MGEMKNRAEEDGLLPYHF